MSNSTLRSRRGFTLIELLLVIGIIAILASIVIVAINPTRQLGSARDAQRHADVLTIMNAVYQYAIDHNGKFPNTLSGSTLMNGAALVKGTAYPICRNQGCTGPYVNIWAVTGSYVTAIPQDPSLTSATGASGYRVTVLSNGRLQIDAPSAEQTAGGISVQR